MKKILVISALLWISILFFWCSKKDNTDTSDIAAVIPSTETSDDLCWDNNWVLTKREEWWDVTICLFDDETFCFLEDLESWDCEKGFLPLYDNEVDNTWAEEITYDECNQTEQDIVCWKDWNTYFNKCYLDASGIEEETEFAHVENWECIFEEQI